jgi:hypothetical protein
MNTSSSLSEVSTNFVGLRGAYFCLGSQVLSLLYVKIISIDLAFLFHLIPTNIFFLLSAKFPNKF